MASGFRSTGFVGPLPQLTFRTSIAGVIGLLAVASGFQSLADPVRFSPNFGIRITKEGTNAAAAAAPFVSLRGGRNVAIGRI
jgi:hypothetical protein